MKQTHKTNQRGVTLVEIGIAIVVLLILSGISAGLYQNIADNGRIAALATIASTIETQSELAEIQTGCTPLQIGFLITGNGDANNNSCGTNAGDNDSYLKFPGGDDTTAVTLANIHAEAVVQLNTVLVTNLIYLQVDGPDTIMTDLARRLCGTGTTTPTAITQAGEVCGFNGTAIHRRIGQ